MNLNEFSHIKSEFSQLVQMLSNHIVEAHFFSKLVLSGSNSHERSQKVGRGLMPKCPNMGGA